MKKIFFVAIYMIFSALGYAQTSKLFEAKEIVWFGLDFSNVRCVGEEGFNDPEQIRKYYFLEWNHLIIRELDKYDFEKAYKKDSVLVDINVVKERNPMMKVEDLVSNYPYAFPEGVVEEALLSYKTEYMEDGIGLVYFIESLNHIQKQAAVHVIFFDLRSHQILWSRKYFSLPGGFGFRNNWARAFYNTLKQSSLDYSNELRNYERQLRKAKRKG